MSLGLLEQMKKDLVQALKSGDTFKAEALRYILSAVHNAEIDKGKDATLTEDEMIVLLQGQAKQRKESIKAYMKGGRDDLVGKEGAELEIIQSYLPEQPSEDELRQMAKIAIKEVDASGPSDMGKVMGALMPKLKGRADGSIVSRIVMELLK